jgi:hypothetical protein
MRTAQADIAITQREQGLVEKMRRRIEGGFADAPRFKGIGMLMGGEGVRWHDAVLLRNSNRFGFRDKNRAVGVCYKNLGNNCAAGALADYAGFAR